MPRPPRRHGRAVAPITDEGTGEVLGWTYEWDNGEASRLTATDLPPGLEPEPEAADMLRARRPVGERS